MSVLAIKKVKKLKQRWEQKKKKTNKPKATAKNKNQNKNKKKNANSNQKTIEKTRLAKAKNNTKRLKEYYANKLKWFWSPTDIHYIQPYTMYI